MTSNIDSWARHSFRPGARVELAPYRGGRFFPGVAAYDGETGVVQERAKNGNVKVLLDTRHKERRNDPEVPLMALRPEE